MVWEGGTLLKFGFYLSYLSFNTSDIQQLDATHRPSNNAEKAKQSTGYSPQRCQVASQSHVQVAVVLVSIWVALKNFLVWKFSFPPLNKGGSSHTESFGGIFLPALFLSMNSMLVNVKYNTGILTLQPVVLYSLLAIPQPGVAQELPSASLSLS